MKKKKSAGD